MKDLLALLFLCVGAFSLNENDTSSETNTSITKNNTRTFRGHLANDYQPIPSHILYAGTEPSTKKVLNCTEATNRKPIQGNHSTQDFLRSPVSTKLIPTVYIAVVIVGVPSNVIILWMLFRHVRSVCTAIFYTSLAISDLLFCLMLPFKIAYHLNGNNWIFGETLCKVTTILFYGNMYCSIFLLMGISINRYIAIVHPFIYRSLPKRAYTILACTLMWIVVLVFMMPFFTIQLTFKVDADMVTCHDIQDVSSDVFQFHYFISLVVFGFLIPLSVVTFCYVSIMRALTIHDHKRSLYVKISILLLAIFAFCFTPSNIILLVHQIRYHYSHKDDLYGCYLMALCLSSLNSCLDPFLYFLMSKITNPSSYYVTMTKTSKETHLKLLSSTI